MSAKGGYVYILSNKNKTVFYIGVTAEIRNRIYQHKYENGSKFTSKYNCVELMFYEFFDTIEEAILIEKKFKNRDRVFKLKLINKQNANMIDLSKGWFDESENY